MIKVYFNDTLSLKNDGCSRSYTQLRVDLQKRISRSVHPTQQEKTFHT